MKFTVDRSRSIICAIILGRKVTAMDVAWLRREVFAEGEVSRDAADELFAVERAGVAPTPEWTELFVEMITEHVVWQSRPTGVVSEAQAEWLIERCELRLGQCAGGAGQCARRGSSGAALVPGGGARARRQGLVGRRRGAEILACRLVNSRARRGGYDPRKLLICGLARARTRLSSGLPLGKPPRRRSGILPAAPDAHAGHSGRSVVMNKAMTSSAATAALGLATAAPTAAQANPLIIAPAAAAAWLIGVGAGGISRRRPRSRTMARYFRPAGPPPALEPGQLAPAA